MFVVGLCTVQYLVFFCNHLVGFLIFIFFLVSFGHLYSVARPRGTKLFLQYVIVALPGHTLLLFNMLALFNSR